ncbi:hypothetical protein B0F90DRAFT_1665240 [Multifurca ochricompacta]|uniref:Uncharacterized protein n=1 Tax=Multifurca ochricompacta TaxID=376703 RepID=A0AAD4MBK7_9AGAM|nr:hypothetical protein B0F90DRAFT_1665240 [Multifurca ochricompacta]
MTSPSSLAPIPGAVPGSPRQKLKSSPSVESLPNSHPCLEDTANMLNLNLPPNAMKVLAQCQAAGRLPAQINSPAQTSALPVTPTTTARRPTAKSYSQPNMLKPGGASPYARGVPVPKSVPQPLEAASHQPPSVKARARREAQAKAKAPPPAAVTGMSTAQARPTTSWDNRQKRVAQAGRFQAGSAARVPPISGLSMAPTHPGTPWGDRSAHSYQRFATCIYYRGTIESPDPARHPNGRRHPEECVVAQSDAKLAAATEDGDTSATFCARNIPTSLIDRLLVRLTDGAAGPAAPKRSHTWVGGDTERTMRSPLAPSTNLLPAMGPYMVGPTVTGQSTLGQPLGGPSGDFQFQLDSEHLPIMPPQMLEELALRIRQEKEKDLALLIQQEMEKEGYPGFNFLDPMVPTVEGTQPSAALERILDLEFNSVVQSGRDEARIAPPSRAEIERSLLMSLAPPTDTNHPTESEGDARIGELVQYAVDLLDESWTGFVDFKG